MQNKSASPVKSAFFVVASRWLDRLIGFLSTLILARLLVPEDFGLIAMASIVIGLAEVLFDVGVNVFLIQAKNPEKSHFDTAWTIRIIQGATIFAVAAAFSPFFADYFNDPRVAHIVIWLSFGSLIAASENIGIVCFQRNMQFGLEFRYLFIKRLAGFAVTISFAFLLKSYIALIVGTLVSRCVGVFLSYFMHPMRPSLSLKKYRELLAVSVWLMAKNIIAYIDGNLHKFVLGGRADSATLGGYTVACELADMPGTEVLAPINRVLFPLLSRNRGNQIEQERIFSLTQGIHLLLIIPLSIGLYVLAHEIVHIVFGEKWIFIVDILKIVAFFNIINALTSASNYLLLANGAFRVVMMLSTVQLVAFILLLLLNPATNTATDIAFIRLLSLIFGAIIGYPIFVRVVPSVSVFKLFKNLIRPMFGAAVMGWAVFSMINGWGAFEHIVLRFFAAVGYGAVIYITVVMLIWRLQGRPDSAEKYVVEKLNTAFGRGTA
jgi:O-antigen/teichoic acid export membrane protein